MLNIKLMLEMGRRLQPEGQWWSKDTADAAQQSARDAAYCIDAPDEMPAGSVEWEQVDEELGAPFPTTALREPAND